MVRPAQIGDAKTRRYDLGALASAARTVVATLTQLRREPRAYDELKAIDIEVTEGTMQGQKYKGIYEVSKDALKICRSGDRGDRPTGFSTKPGKGERMAVFKRATK